MGDWQSLKQRQFGQMSESGRKTQFWESGFLSLNLSGTDQWALEVHGGLGGGAGRGIWKPKLSLWSLILYHSEPHATITDAITVPFPHIVQKFNWAFWQKSCLIELTQILAVNCRTFLFLVSGVTLIVTPGGAPPSCLVAHGFLWQALL